MKRSPKIISLWSWWLKEWPTLTSFSVVSCEILATWTVVDMIVFVSCSCFDDCSESSARDYFSADCSLLLYEIDSSHGKQNQVSSRESLKQTSTSSLPPAMVNSSCATSSPHQFFRYMSMPRRKNAIIGRHRCCLSSSHHLVAVDTGGRTADQEHDEIRECFLLRTGSSED